MPDYWSYRRRRPNPRCELFGRHDWVPKPCRRDSLGSKQEFDDWQICGRCGAERLEPAKQMQRKLAAMRPPSPADWLVLAYLLTSAGLCVAMLAATEFVEGLAFLGGSVLGLVSGGAMRVAGGPRKVATMILSAAVLSLGASIVVSAGVHVHLYGTEISAGWWVLVGCLAAVSTQFDDEAR